VKTIFFVYVNLSKTIPLKALIGLFERGGAKQKCPAVEGWAFRG
jgi:hypothetical protein